MCQENSRKHVALKWMEHGQGRVSNDTSSDIIKQKKVQIYVLILMTCPQSHFEVKSALV